MSSPPEPDDDRILLLRTAPDTLVAVRRSEPGTDAEPGWHALPLAIAQQLAEHLPGQGATGAAGRVFAVHPADLSKWDRAGHYFKDEWAYAVNVDANRHFAGSPRIKELTAPASTPAPDPLTIATAVAVAQLEAQVDALTRIAEETRALSIAVLAHIRDGQEAQVLATVEIVAAAHRLLTATGAVDIDDWKVSLAPLELGMRTQHRQLLAELRAVHTLAMYTNPADAQRFLDDPRTDADRIADVLALLWLNVQALHEWTSLRLTVKAATGALEAAEATTQTRSMEKYLIDVQDATRAIGDVTSTMSRTPLLKAIYPRGFVRQRLHENALEETATDRREQIVTLAKARTTVNLLPATAAVRLLESPSPAA